MHDKETPLHEESQYVRQLQHSRILHRQIQPHAIQAILSLELVNPATTMFALWIFPAGLHPFFEQEVIRALLQLRGFHNIIENTPKVFYCVDFGNFFKIGHPLGGGDPGTAARCGFKP